VLTVAAGFLAGTSTNAGNRLLSTAVGALVGMLATVLIPVPRSTEPSSSSDPSAKPKARAGLVPRVALISTSRSWAPVAYPLHFVGISG
jgi:hypothetical protein